MLRAAVIGLGRWGRRISEALQGSDRLRVVHGVELDPEPAREFAASMGFRLTTAYEEALENPEVEAVILATPPSQHEAQVLAALAAGMQIFCEKPFTPTQESAARVLAACAEAGVVVGSGFERRYDPALVELRRLAAAGAIGTVLHLEANYSHNKMGVVPDGHWRADRREGPHPGMVGQGIHLVDLFLQIAGPVDEVFVYTARRVREFEAGDVVSTQMRFRDGTTGAFAASVITPFYGRVAALGDRGWIETSEDLYVYEGAHTRLRMRGEEGEPSERSFEPIDTVRLNLEAWAEAVEGGAAYPIRPEDIVGTVGVLEAMSRSIGSGRPEPVG